MKRSVFGVFASVLLVFSLMLMPGVLAHHDGIELLKSGSDNSGSGSSGDSSGSSDSGSDKSGKSDRGEEKSSKDSEDSSGPSDKDESKSESKDGESKSESRIRDSGVSEDKREVRTKVLPGGIIERKIKDEKRFIDEDGNERKIKIEIEEEVDRGEVKRKIKIKEENGEGDLEFRVEGELEIEEEEDGERVKVKAKLKNGEEKEIRVLPDRASEIAREKLKIRFGEENVEIREIEHKNVPRVVYHIQGDKPGKFLGIFKLAMKVEADIDAETGEEIVVNKPWWAFLVAETIADEDEPTSPPVEENDTIINDSVSNDTIINDSIVVDNPTINESEINVSDSNETSESAVDSGVASVTSA